MMNGWTDAPRRVVCETGENRVRSQARTAGSTCLEGLWVGTVVKHHLAAGRGQVHPPANIIEDS